MSKTSLLESKVAESSVSSSHSKSDVGHDNGAVSGEFVSIAELNEGVADLELSEDGAPGEDGEDDDEEDDDERYDEDDESNVERVLPIYSNFNYSGRANNGTAKDFKS